jgi:hypothetical protein
VSAAVFGSLDPPILAPQNTLDKYIFQGVFVPLKIYCTRTLHLSAHTAGAQLKRPGKVRRDPELRSAAKTSLRRAAHPLIIVQHTGPNVILLLLPMYQLLHPGVNPSP